PAAQGPFFLSLKPKTIEFYVASQTRPFASINPPDIGAAPAAQGFGQAETIQQGRRFIWIPAAKLLVCLSMTDDKLFLLRVDVDELLKAAPTDYLVMFSTPPAEAIRGGRLDYPLDVRAKAGGVNVRLESGPAGMKVNGTHLIWDVPEGF